MRQFKYITVINDYAIAEDSAISTAELEKDYISRREDASYLDHEYMDLLEEKYGAIEYVKENKLEQFLSEEWLRLPGISVSDDLAKYALALTLRDSNYKIMTCIFSDIDFVHESYIVAKKVFTDGVYKEVGNDKG